MSEPEATGVPAVDAALARLATAANLEPAAQVEVYEHVHRALQDALADLADQPEAGGPGPGSIDHRDSTG